MEISDDMKRYADLVTGDNNLSSADWSTMFSSNQFETQFLDILFEFNFSDSSPTQLGGMQCNDPEIGTNCTINQDVHKSYSLNGKPCYSLNGKHHYP